MSNHAILLLIVLFTFPLSPFSNPTSTTGTLTLASKLVHRYSSEYYHWISKNQTESNPTFDTWWNGNTSEQQRLLLQHDFTRQQTITSPHLLFPQQGSRTLFFGNDLAWLHYTWVDIGTPSISFLVALDTGSDLFWVPCDCIQCSSLSASTYTRSLDRDLSEYSPSLSNTSRHIPCGHQLCPSHLECDNLKEPCPYMVTYDDPGNTSSSGILIEDKLHLASMGGHSIERGVQASVIIGYNHSLLTVKSFLWITSMFVLPARIGPVGKRSTPSSCQTGFDSCWEHIGSKMLKVLGRCGGVHP